MKKQVVFVAMSGGVDSSVAAGLLLESNYEVVGVTMCFSLPEREGGRPACCGPEAIDDARRVAGVLGISHYVLDFGAELRDKIIADFNREYAAGRTPNPCIRCNELLKFDSLLNKSVAMGADFIATGHYAQIEEISRGMFLKKGIDTAKDQSYFLYRLRGGQMRKILLPLGGLTKEEVREHARRLGLPVAEKRESQEICFIPGKEELSGMRLRAAPDIRPGPIVDTSGKVIGTHEGISLYTVGQRRGLDIAAPQPLHVVRIDAARNTIVAGTREEVFSREFTVRETLWPNEPLQQPADFTVKIRSIYKGAAATVTPEGDGARVVFKEPQFAIAPGQSAVFYDGDIVAGGGIIDEVLDEKSLSCDCD